MHLNSVDVMSGYIFENVKIIWYQSKLSKYKSWIKNTCILDLDVDPMKMLWVNTLILDFNTYKWLLE